LAGLEKQAKADNMKQKISITINEKILKAIDAIIDNVYIRNRSQAIESLIELSIGENKTAIILSGGDEEKLRISEKEYRLTANLGKITLIEAAIKKLKDSGFKNIHVIARHNILTAVFDLVKDGSAYGVNINYLEEKTANGSAESLRYAKGAIKNTFLVVYGDLIFNKINLEELWQDHIKQRSIATLMLSTNPTPPTGKKAMQPVKKGVVTAEGSRVIKFEQIPKEKDEYLGFSSIFIAEPEIFEYAGKSLEEDIFPKLAEKGLLKGRLSSEKPIHIHSKKNMSQATSVSS
jgi:NDP-sugar pyrophosphorylase family protein